MKTRLSIAYAILVITVTLLFVFPLTPANSQTQSSMLPEVKWVLQTTEATHEDWSTKAWGDFSKRVAERTNGKFKLRVVLVQELGIDRNDFPKALADGTIELSYLLTAVLEGFMKHMGVFDVPYLTVTRDDVMKAEQATASMTKSKMQALGYQPISFWVWYPQDIIAKRTIDDFADLRGYKIRIWRSLDGELIKAMKGEPVYLAGTECYTGLQRGVIDAVNTGINGMIDRSLYEVAKYYYPLALPRSGCYLGVNTKKFEALPAEYKKILIEESKNTQDHFAKIYNSQYEQLLRQLFDKGVKRMEIPDAGTRAWQDAAGPVWNKWASANPDNQPALSSVKTALGLK